MALKFGNVVEFIANSIPVTAIINLAATVKAYTLNEFGAPTSSVSMNGQRLTNLGAPTANTDAGTKGYVDTTAGAAQTAAVAAAKTYTDTQDAATRTAAVADAKTYTDSTAASTRVAAVADAKAYTDTNVVSARDQAVASAKTYTDTQDAATLAAAKAYTDGKTVPANMARIIRGSFTGNGSTTIFDITHGMGSVFFVFSLIDAANQFVLVDAFPLTVNTARITFGVAPANGANYYWTVVG